MGVDYLQPTGRFVRILSFVACFVASVICWFFVAIAIVGLQRPSTSVADQKTAWFVIVFFSILGSATAAICYRLARGIVAPNRITTMPIWFIQAFGVFFLVGLAVVGIAEGKWMIALEGTSIGLAMIFIGRQVAKRGRASIRFEVRQ